jgi:hypothetical protein
LLPEDDSFHIPASAAGSVFSAAPQAVQHEQAFELTLSLAELQLPALVRLELWTQLPAETALPSTLQSAQAVTHAHPLLVLPLGKSHLAAELCDAQHDSGLAMLQMQPLELLTRLGLFLEFADCMQQLSRQAAEAFTAAVPSCGVHPAPTAAEVSCHALQACLAAVFAPALLTCGLAAPLLPAAGCQTWCGRHLARHER